MKKIIKIATDIILVGSIVFGIMMLFETLEEILIKILIFIVSLI